MRFLEKIFQSINSQVLPSACIVCERYQQHSICAHCLESLNINGLLNYECCYQCGITLNTAELKERRCEQCNLYPPYFDETFCLDSYEGELQNAVHQLKYQKRMGLQMHGIIFFQNNSKMSRQTIFFLCH
jgi:predicted amidophosphoribosyltransferase